GSRLIGWSTCSTGSRNPRNPAVPAWAWPSPSRWSRRMAGRSRWRATAPGRCSRSSFPPADHATARLRPAMRLSDLFAEPKPIVGPVQLLPLPGSPGYGGSIEAVVAAALEDAQALVEGGIDGLILENLGD